MCRVGQPIGRDTESAKLVRPDGNTVHTQAGT